MSHPFIGKQFTFTMANGQRLEVRGWGDQRSARFETLDGRPVVKDIATGEFTVGAQAAIATLEAPSRLPLNREAGPSILSKKTRWEERNEQFKVAMRASIETPGVAPAPPGRKTVGVYIGLCLPIQFTDMAAAVGASKISDFCNKPGYSGYSNKGSVRDYFLANSISKCDYSTVVAPMYTSKRSRAYYTDPAIPYGVRAQELIHEALAYHKTQGFNFAQLTADSQNYVYALNVFYAGAASNNWSQGLWPHASALQTTVTLAPGKVAHDYQITALGDQLDLGTYCHENGHMLCDFPDLYDYDSDSAGVGFFCLMCGGNNADQKNPVQIGAYLKYRAGWAGLVKNLTAGLAATASAADNQFFLLRNSSTEYYIVENRVQAGRDAALPDAGLAVWHVDELGNNRYQQGTPTKHYECALIQADGRMDLEGNVNQGDSGDLFSGGKFTGKWWNNASIGISIINISAAGPSMTFTVS
jgi:M6 family metalloprotease-like protein